MNLSVKNYKKRAFKPSSKVVIENQLDGTVKATLLSLPDYQANGKTKEEALNNLIQLLQERQPEIVMLEIKPSHPWQKFAGMHKDNPLFEEVLKYIADERSQFE
jgi:hypothetical protein